MRHAVLILGHPEECLEVAQTAFAFFYIGLDNIALTLLDVARIAFGQLGLDKVSERVVEQILPQAVVQFPRQFGVAANRALFQQGSTDRIVLAPQAQAIINRARGMAHFQAQIP